MKSYLWLFLVVCLFAIFVACEQHNTMTSPRTEPIEGITIGVVHTEVLSAIYAKLDAARTSTDKSKLNNDARQDVFLDACLDAANEVNHKYGIEPLTLAEVQMHVEYGKELAETTAEFDMRKVLTTRWAREWWDRYSLEATAENAREVYEDHCQLYGQPRAGSPLDNIMQIVISSAEFWIQYRGDDEPLYIPPALAAGLEEYPLLITVGWKDRLLRFAVNVAVDGLAGGLAGAGAAAVTGGAGTGLAAGVVGGLASAGADDIIFGDQ